MDIDSDTSGDNCGDNRDNHGHGGFRPGAGRKRKAATTSNQVTAKKNENKLHVDKECIDIKLN
jgi:hypothetical protein